MKTALPTTGTGLHAAVDRSFGRTAQFMLVDTDTMDFDILENRMNREAAQGAGIQSAQRVMEAGAEAVLAIQMGPKAFRVLQAANIPVYRAECGTVKEAVSAFSNGDLEQLSGANVEGM